jgi:Tfp pilus assembly protein PilO
MTGRDRMVVIAVGVLVILGAAWMLVVSPKRQQASQLNTQVASAQSQLQSAEGKVSSARAAQSQYAAAYASLVNIGKAVPPSQEVPALIDELTQASNQKKVDFDSITNGGGSTGASASAATAAFTTLPFSFTFEGSYFDLEHLFNKLTSFATLTSAGDLQVNGRLLTIQSVRLAPVTTGSSSNTAGSELTGSITASAYVLPASQGVTGATSAVPSTGAATPAATSTTTGSSPTSPAVIKVNP